MSKRSSEEKSSSIPADVPHDSVKNVAGSLSIAADVPHVAGSSIISADVPHVKTPKGTHGSNAVKRGMMTANERNSVYSSTST